MQLYFCQMNRIEKGIYGAHEYAIEILWGSMRADAKQTGYHPVSPVPAHSQSANQPVITS